MKKLTNFIAHSLSFKLIIPVLLLGIVTLSVIISVELLLASQSLEKVIATEHDEILETLAIATEANSSIENLQRVVFNLASRSHIKRLTIINSRTQKIVSDSDMFTRGRDIPFSLDKLQQRAFAIFSNNGFHITQVSAGNLQIRVSVLPLFDPNINRLRQHWIMVTLDNTTHKQFALNDMLSVLAIFVVGLLITLLGTFWVVQHQLITPLITFAASVRGQSDSSAMTLIKHQRQDELGVLADTYNKLVVDSQQLEESKKAFKKQSKLASIGELAAGIGHEINNPLSIILNNAEMLLAKSSSEALSGDDSQKPLESIYNASERAAKIVKGLKGISRLNTEVKIAEIGEINHICKSTVEMMQGLYKSKGIDINYQFPESNCYVQIDVVSLQQVLINLIENAKDAVLNNDEKKIFVLLEKKATMCVLKISDNGYGISDDIQDKIFEPFYTTKSLGKGTGLGLSVINTIIQNVGGTISVQSSKTSGTTFSIELPAKSHKPAKVDEPTSPKISNNIKILIVDDEPDIGAVVNQCLTGEGHQTVTCTSVKEAIKLCQETVFDLLITDFMMPEQNGIELISKVRNFTGYETTKFMLMTGKSMDDLDGLVTENMTDIADVVIKKPFTLKHLVSQISLLMSNK
jgi:signal transduction histidine kinase/CheY-like chemotaxis protein